MPDALQQGGMGEAFMAPLRGAVDDEQLTMGIAFARVQHPNMYRGPDGACELRCYPLRATPEAQIWRSASRAAWRAARRAATRAARSRSCVGGVYTDQNANVLQYMAPLAHRVV